MMDNNFNIDLQVVFASWMKTDEIEVSVNASQCGFLMTTDDLKINVAVSIAGFPSTD